MQRLLRLSRESPPRTASSPASVPPVCAPRPVANAISVHDATFSQISQEYGQLTQRLGVYFRARRCPVDELVAETLFRLVVKAAEGRVILDLSRYAGGIAKHVYADWVATQVAVDDAFELLQFTQRSPKAECLARCLALLGAHERELLEAYYLDPRHDRARLLAESGISANALRLRIFHVKERLRGCMTRCLAARGTG